jgi:uncharacterized membrane protein
MEDLQDIIDAQTKILSTLEHLQQNDPDRDFTFGERIAEKVARFIGSWKFILMQSAFFAIWITYNSLLILRIIHFDPYPFILLNLILSFQASFLSPMILMSQNRAEEKDRRRLHDAYNLVVRIDKMLADISVKIAAKNGNGKT